MLLMQIKDYIFSCKIYILNRGDTTQVHRHLLHYNQLFYPLWKIWSVNDVQKHVGRQTGQTN